MIIIADFESTWDEIDRCRKRDGLSRAIAISRRQFERGEFQPEGEVFDEMEKMLDTMQSTENARDSRLVTACEGTAGRHHSNDIFRCVFGSGL